MTRIVPDNLVERFETTYKLMASKARYRPAAPSDGIGNITVPMADLDLDQEAADWATAWLTWRENQILAVVGCASYEQRAILAVVIEAASCICGMANRPAILLLRLAADLLEKQGRSSRRA